MPAFPALDSPRTMVLAFGAPELASTPEVFTELRRAYPRAHVLGCSTSGEIVGSEVRDHSLSVAVVRFSRTTLATASVVVGDAAGSFPAGQVLAHKLHEPGLRAIVLLAEGLEIGGSELLRGIKSVIDDTVVITGGLAGDGLRFQRTWVLSGDAVQSSLVTAVGLYGDYVSVGQGAEGGWQPLGPTGTITRSSGNVLLEIDGRPALAWYREHLGEHAAGLPATGLLFPLGLEMKDASLGFLARTVMAIDEGVESMTLAGDMPQNASVHLLGAVSAQLIEGARVAAEGAADDVETMGEIGLGLLVSAVGRRVVLGDRSRDELAAAAAVLPEGVTTTGFYAYGGFAAFRGRATELFNQTFLATVITESEEPLTRPTAAAVSASTSMPRTFSTASAPTPLQATPGGHRASQRLRRAVPRAGELSRRDVAGVRVIELGGQIDEAFDGRAVGAALGPVTVLDLASIERVSSHGVREWVQMMESADVEALYLARCAEPLVNQLLLVRAMLGQASVISFAAPYVCKECDHTFVHMLDCEHDAAAISAAEPPEVPCPRCGRSARFDDDIEAYRAFFEPHLGRPVPAAVRRVLAASDASGPSGTGPSITFTEPMPEGWPVQAGRRAWPALRSAAGGALVMGVILAAVYWTLLRPPRTEAAGNDNGGTPGTALVPPAVDAGSGTKPERPGELPPAWVDRAFDVQPDEVLVVGRSGMQDDVHDAVDAAYRDAVYQLLVHMVPYLDESPIYSYLRTNLDLSSVREAGARPQAARVMARYQLQVGDAAMPVRVDAVRAERDGHVSIVGYYRLSRVEFERVLAYYRAAERALGMTVATVFPLLAADMPGQSDLLVIEVEQSSPADRAGVVAGDLIVSVGGHDVSSLEEYALAANQRWETTRSRHSLDLELFSSGAQVIRSLKKR